jgi:hypothetical protein
MTNPEPSAARARIRKLVRRVDCRNPDCGHRNSPYSQECEKCGAPMCGGVVFSAAQSGTEQRDWLNKLRAAIEDAGSSCHFHDVGAIMEEFAREFDPNINWDRILDRPEEELRFRRAQAFAEIRQRILDAPAELHLLACHLTFRWRAYLTRGLDPHLLAAIGDPLRLFLTVVDGVNEVHSRLAKTDWGDRKRLQLAVSRDEEVFFTGLLADMFKRPHYIVARQEPAENVAQLVLAPWRPRVYLSFPITALKDDAAGESAQEEVRMVRDSLRRWAVVFDPLAIRDYDLTYQVPEMEEIAQELGEQTEQRDFRFIDQSEILVAFFPKVVPSKGVDAELRHARTTGKMIYLCYPQEAGGPFNVTPDCFAASRDELLDLARSHFEGLDSPED